MPPLTASDMKSYSTPPIKIGTNYYIIEGRHPAVPYLFDRDKAIREYAQFMMDMWIKYAPENRWHWWSFRIPEPPYRIHRIPVFEGTLSKRDRALGWILTAWALVRMVRP